jgi:two-component system, sensor histidine kinase and response regulator
MSLSERVLMSFSLTLFTRPDSAIDTSSPQGDVFNTLLDSLDGMVYRCRDDGEWTMEYVSDGCHRLTGYQPDDLLFNNRVSYESITHPADRTRVRATIHMAVASRRRYEVEYRIIDSVGYERWVMERGAAVVNASGDVLALEGIITDITRLKLAEQAAREAELRYRSLFDNALEGIFRTTVEGKYIDANQALARIYGFDSPDQLMYGVLDIRQQLYVEPQRRDEFLVQVKLHGTVSHFESQVYRKDGRVIWISENARAIFDEQQQLSWLEGTVEDITEQKQYQQSLIEASELASAANQAKSAFLANMSHEIRTPMNGVIGMTELLLSTQMERNQRDCVETIRSSADALLTVINDVLDFSKIEAGKMDIDVIDMDLRATVEDIASMMAFQAAAKNLELIINISPEVPERVRADPQRIRQCLVNLAGNAIKFTHSGEIVITLRVIAQHDEQVVVVFEVRDTGIGIADNTLNELFQPFVQADSSTTRHFGGTGLGLSIVRRLVELMGGEVGVTSQINTGSTFWFSLPLTPVEATGTMPALKLGSGGRRVLVVDDSETNRRVVAGHLQYVGYEVEQASNGQQALTALKQASETTQAFDVVLVDMQMPAMDGATLGQRINSDAQLSRSRLIMLTSMDRQGDVQQFAALGFAGYLAKPVRARELYACVEHVLGYEAHEWHEQKQPLVTRGALKEAAANQRFIGRVLVVEDNQVNQVVARKFLERHGCNVTVANNGAEGVSAYEAGQFDLVFMDMQMPVMDGLTATRKIRDFEGWRSRTPIVALTANAMMGQAERCIAAGMDGFLTKPIESTRLRDVLQQYLQTDETTTSALHRVLSQSAEIQTAPAQSTQAQSAQIQSTHLQPIHHQPIETGNTSIAAIALDMLAMDRTTALVDWHRFEALTSGDNEFARELIELYLSSSMQLLVELRDGCSAGDRDQLRKSAHKFKGASANVSADRLAGLCKTLEITAEQNSPGQVLQLLDAIEQSMLQTREAMQRYMAALK